ncbi:hypothetical protein JB92DRAFT_521280 [Gautieria morchelliformis]|nr:hypothetical protein JB92DRAFT_521280 [Gautieria morchelliformis]
MAGCGGDIERGRRRGQAMRRAALEERPFHGDHRGRRARRASRTWEARSARTWTTARVSRTWMTTSTLSTSQVHAARLRSAIEVGDHGSSHACHQRDADTASRMSAPTRKTIRNLQHVRCAFPLSVLVVSDRDSEAIAPVSSLNILSVQGKNAFRRCCNISVLLHPSFLLRSRVTGQPSTYELRPVSTLNDCAVFPLSRASTLIQRATPIVQRLIPIPLAPQLSELGYHLIRNRQAVMYLA